MWSFIGLFIIFTLWLHLRISEGHEKPGGVLYMCGGSADLKIHSACIGVLVRSISFLIRTRTRLGRLRNPPTHP